MDSSTPPPLPVPAKPPKGTPLGIASLAVAGIGLLPLLVYYFDAMEAHFDGFSFFLLLMTVFGLLVHMAGAALGGAGLFLGERVLSIFGLAANCLVLLLIVFGALIGAS